MSPASKSAPRKRRNPARIFLWTMATLIMLVMALALLYKALEMHLFRWAMVPSVPFEAAAQPLDYTAPAQWVARPDIVGNPALWVPAGRPAPASPDGASVFFIHPTSYLDSTRWNAPMDDADSRQRAELFVRSQASAFNAAGRIWAPRYRQATFGAFLTDAPDATSALDLAYRDVLAAFDVFLRQAPADRPIVLAAHSQGSFHLLRLLRERVANSPLRARIAAAYVVGWPISTTADLPSLPLPACQRAEDSGCILSWMAYAEPADTALLTENWERTTGFNGGPRAGSDILCVNPLSGNLGDNVPATANVGTLIPNAELTDAAFQVQSIPARCAERGVLSIGADPPAMGPYVLPGNNYHVYDYTLFWGNVRADAERRVAAFAGRR